MTEHNKNSNNINPLSPISPTTIETASTNLPHKPPRKSRNINSCTTTELTSFPSLNLKTTISLTTTSTNNNTTTNKPPPPFTRNKKVKPTLIRRIITDVKLSQQKEKEKRKHNHPKSFTRRTKLYLLKKIQDKLDTNNDHKRLPRQDITKELQSKFKGKSKKERPLLKINLSKGINNFIIRDSRHIADPEEYILRSKYNLKVSDEFYRQKQLYLKEHIQSNIDKFYRIRDKKPCEEILHNEVNTNVNTVNSVNAITSSNNNNNAVASTTNAVSNNDKEQQQNFIRNRKSRNRTRKKTTLRYRTSEDDYHSTKEQYFQTVHEGYMERSKILADLILNMKPGENKAEFMENLDNKKDPIILRNCLDNSIYLNKINKKKYLVIDEDVGLNDGNVLRQEIKKTKYETIRALKGMDTPRFLKEKFSHKTHVKYKSTSGKYFGVVC